MIIKINMKSETPIYLQLRNEIVKGIGKGEFEIGESLPTVRQMAAELGVNTMTVSKAYQLLKSEGFIETDRRKGTIVCNPQSDENKLGGEFQEKLADELELLSAEASIEVWNRKTLWSYAVKLSREWRLFTYDFGNYIFADRFIYMWHYVYGIWRKACL